MTQRQRPGRPAHQPTDASRELVRKLVARGKSPIEIALAIEISAPTLRAHYRAELHDAAQQKRIPLPDFSDPAPSRAAPPGAGRPPHVPTQDIRDRVEILLGGGMPAWQVAQAIGVSESTLAEYYAEQLAGGRARKMADVIEAMFKAATADGNVSAQKGYLARSIELDTPPEREAPIGKKAAATAAAQTADRGTDWEGLLPN